MPLKPLEHLSNGFATDLQANVRYMCAGKSMNVPPNVLRDCKVRKSFEYSAIFLPLGLFPDREKLRKGMLSDFLKITNLL